MNDSLSKPLTFNDERFTFLTRVVYWLEARQSLPEKGGKLSNQTFTSFRHACLVIPQIINYLTKRISAPSQNFEYFKMFSNPTVTSTFTLKEFIESFSPLSSEQTDFEFDLDPFLSATSDLSIIECST